MKKLTVVGVLLASGIAIACTMEALIVPPVDVPLEDIEQARRDGYSNPAEAAALQNLDAVGQALYPNWHGRGFAGHFTYRTTVLGMTGTNILYMEKQCNEFAIDRAEQSGGGGGFAGGGEFGGNPSPGMNCVTFGGGTGQACTSVPGSPPRCETIRFPIETVCI
jgi:hypothetical protein